MKQRSDVLYVTPIQGSSRLMCYFWCPGCVEAHTYWVQNPGCPPAEQPLWTWDGNLDAPTFRASLLLHPHERIIDPDLEGEALTAAENKTLTFQCHLFITAGVIDFLTDCTHPLAGQKVPMVALPDWAPGTSSQD